MIYAWYNITEIICIYVTFNSIQIFGYEIFPNEKSEVNIVF